MPTAECFREDAQYIIERVLDVHPDPARFASEDAIERAAEAFRGAAESCESAADFWELAQCFLVRLADAHTGMQPLARDTVEVPAALTLIEGQVVVEATAPGFGDLKRGDAILFIDEREVGRSLAAALTLQPYNNYEYGRRAAAHRLLVFKDDREEVTLTVGLDGGKVTSCTVPCLPSDHRTVTQWKQERERVRMRGIIRSELWNSARTGYLKYAQCVDRTIPYFVDRAEDAGLQPEQLPVLRDECRRLFGAMRRSGADHLVLDLRGNTGGASFLAYSLLNYLAREPLETYVTVIKVSEGLKEFLRKNRDLYPEYYQPGIDQLLAAPAGSLSVQEQRQLVFPYDGSDAGPEAWPLFGGQLVVLTDQLTFSSGEWLAVELRDNGIGCFVGEPTGGGGSVPGDTLGFRTPNLDLGFTVSHKLFTRPDADEERPAIVPDYLVRQSLRDFRDGTDTVLQWVKERLISGKPLGPR